MTPRPGGEPQSWRVWPVIKMIPAGQVRPPGPAGLDELRDRMDRQAATAGKRTARTTRAATDVIGGDGKVRVLSHRCGTCLFRRDQPFGAARATEVIKANVDAGALLTCHSTLPYGAHPDFGPAVCAGFWAEHAMSTAAGRIARFMLGITRINPPENEAR